MKKPMSFVQYLNKCPVDDFLICVGLAIFYAGKYLLWWIAFPFVPVVLLLNRRIKGKRLARRWKAKYGYTCPERWCWWMKYM